MKGVTLWSLFGVFLLTAIVLMNRDAQRGHGLCSTAGIVGPCDKFPANSGPLKIKLTHGAKDSK